MGKITEIEVRQDTLIEVLSMAVLHCRQEMHKLDYDADQTAILMNIAV